MNIAIAYYNDHNIKLSKGPSWSCTNNVYHY